MAKVSGKTVARAAAQVTYEKAQLKVRKAKATMDTTTDPVKRAEAYQDWVNARMERQTAGKTIRPRRKRDT